jgi:hypothetical protein
MSGAAVLDLLPAGRIQDEVDVPVPQAHALHDGVELLQEIEGLVSGTLSRGGEFVGLQEVYG